MIFKWRWINTSQDRDVVHFLAASVSLRPTFGGPWGGDGFWNTTIIFCDWQGIHKVLSSVLTPAKAAQQPIILQLIPKCPRHLSLGHQTVSVDFYNGWQGCRKLVSSYFRSVFTSWSHREIRRDGPGSGTPLSWQHGEGGWGGQFCSLNRVICAGDPTKCQWETLKKKTCALEPKWCLWGGTTVGKWGWARGHLTLPCWDREGWGEVGFQQRGDEITRMINGRRNSDFSQLSPQAWQATGGGASQECWSRRTLIGLFVLSFPVLGDCGSRDAESLSAGGNQQKPKTLSPKRLTEKAEGRWTDRGHSKPHIKRNLSKIKLFGEISKTLLLSNYILTGIFPVM